MLQEVDRFLAGGRPFDLVTLRLEVDDERLGDVRLVLDEQNFHGRSLRFGAKRGNHTRKVEPRPGPSLNTSTLPR